MNTKKKCCICKKKYDGFGNNPYPVRTDLEAECCNVCNDKYVIPFRILNMTSTKEDAIEVANILNGCSKEKLDMLLGM